MEVYPKETLDLDALSEANRRNLGLVLWYKRIINSIILLLGFSGTCIAISTSFAFVQPLPDLYASSQDGVLYRLEYDENADMASISEKVKQLTMEESSKKAKGSLAAAIIAQGKPLPGDQSSGSNTPGAAAGSAAVGVQPQPAGQAPAPAGALQPATPVPPASQGARP